MDETNTTSSPQSHNVRNIVIGVIVLAIVIAVLSLLPKKSQAPVTNNPVVTDYTTCALAGYPIEQTNPLSCTTPSGQTFTDSSSTTNPDVILDTPQIADIVTSPMTVKGKVLNTWFFEANLPIELLDENGNVLAQEGYTTTDDWTTPGYKTIDTTLTFPAPTTDYGKLVIHNDNPSGDPANQKTFEVPVRFK